MKNIIYGVVAILLGMAFTLTVITITGVMNREIEIENALAEAVENSIEACSGRHDYSLDNNEQFVADLMIELSNAIENDSDLKIDVMGVDKDKGYMSIRVTEYYKTVIGATKTAYCETTAFLDRGSTDITSNAVTVTFIDDDNTYMGQATVPFVFLLTPRKRTHLLHQHLVTLSGSFLLSDKTYDILQMKNIPSVLRSAPILL